MLDVSMFLFHLMKLEAFTLVILFLPLLAGMNSCSPARRQDQRTLSIRRDCHRSFSRCADQVWRWKRASFPSTGFSIAA